MLKEYYICQVTKSAILNDFQANHSKEGAGNPKLSNKKK